MGHELVQGRIQQTDGHWPAGHPCEDGREVPTLHGQQLRQGRLTLGLRLGDDHLPHRSNAVALEEHVLRAAQPNALRTEPHGHLHVAGGVGVGTDLQLAELVADRHQLPEVTRQRGLHKANLLPDDLSGIPVQGDPIPTLESPARDDTLVALHHHVATARDAGLPHAARNHGSVRGHPSTGGEDTLGNIHPSDVLWAGLQPHQHHLLALLHPLLGLLSREHDLPHGRTRAGGQTLGQCLQLQLRVDHGVQQLVELLGLHSGDRLVLLQNTLLHHVHGDLHRGERRTLAVPCLQHVHLLLLDGELHVLHVSVVALQQVLDVHQLLVGRGHVLLQRGELSHAVSLGDVVLLGPVNGHLLGDLLGSANPGNHVLALGVDEVLPIVLVLPSAGVPGEAHSGG
eukprot:RCo045908